MLIRRNQLDPTGQLLGISNPIRIDIGEPIKVHLWHPRTTEEVARLTQELSQQLPEDLTCVAVAPRNASPQWGERLGAVLRLAQRAVPAGNPQVFGSYAKLTEPDLYRAVVGAMQWLRPGSSFVLVWPGWQDPSKAHWLLEQGRRWRAAWDAPEDGQFWPLSEPQCAASLPSSTF